MDAKTRHLIRQQIEEQGYHIDIDRWPVKLTYFKKDGTPMPNLPADPWSIQTYLRKGFLLKPPEVPSDGGNNDDVITKVVKSVKRRKKKKASSKKRESNKGVKI